MKAIVQRLSIALLVTLMATMASADVAHTVTALRDRDWQVREAAAQSLGDLPGADKQVIAALTRVLRDPDSRVRRAAAGALGRIGERAYRSIPDLVTLFDDIDPSVVAAAANATGRMGKRASGAVGDLAGLLEHRDARVRAAASAALGSLGTRARRSADHLNEKLGDRDAAVRSAAAAALGELGPRSSPSISDLVRLLDDEDATVRTAASGTLARIGKPAVPALVRALSNGNPIFLQAVVDTLGRIGPAAVPALVETLQADDSPGIARGYAAMAMAQIAGRDEKIVPALIEALGDDKPGVRMSAAEALGHAGGTAKPAVSRLITVATNSREVIVVREFAISALPKIDPYSEAVEKALVYMVSDGSPRIYQAAVEALLTIRARREGSPDVAAQVAGLIAAVDNGNADAAESLGLIGNKAEAAVPSLIRALESGRPLLRDAALLALKRIGPQQQTIPALVQAMRSGDLASRGAAAARLEAFASARIDVWKPLLHQSDAPVLRNWLARHEALYGLVPDQGLLAPRSTERPIADYFDVMGGRAALRESVQLDLIADPVTGADEVRNISVGDVDPVRVESHPFGRMLEDSDKPIRNVSLANYVPDDRLFAWFRSVDAFATVLEAGASQLMRFESSLASESVEYDLAGRYLRRLGISENMLESLQTLRAVEDFAIVTPDLFFLDGTDLTVVANLSSPSMTAALFELLGIKASAEGEVATHETMHGNAIYWSIQGDVLLVGTSRAEIERMLTLQPKRDKGTLGNSSEFLYMQQQLAIGETTQAYFYLSDPFIRRLVSPPVKIAQLRRIQGRAEMEILAAGAMLYLLDGYRNVPSKQQLAERGYIPAYLEQRDYTIGEDLVVSSGQYGTIGDLKPLDISTVSRITERESKAYDAFVENYSRYWRQFFDPIAVRLDDLGEGAYELQSFVLPLVDSGVYDAVRDMLVTEDTGQYLAIPSIAPGPSMMLSLNVNDDMRVKYSQGLADMLVEYTSVDPEIFDSIGSGIHLAVQDATPIVALGGGDIWGAVSKEMLNLQGFDSFLPFMASIATQPSTILIELADSGKVREFLSEAVVKRAEFGGDGELHKVQGQEAWIYTLDFENVLQIHLRLEIQGGYLLISNLPWTTAVSIGEATMAQLNGGQLTLDLARIEKQLPALHTKVYTDYRAAAVDGMGYIYPLIAAGVADSVQQAVDKHFEIFGFRPVHPSHGEWRWRDGYLESTEFGSATKPVQPGFSKSDTDFGLFAEVSQIRVNMQLENTGLRARISWRAPL